MALHLRGRLPAPAAVLLGLSVPLGVIGAAAGLTALVGGLWIWVALQPAASAAPAPALAHAEGARA